MAKNSEEPADDTKVFVTLSIRNYTEKICFSVNTQKYDRILGQKRTSNHNAVLDYQKNIVTFAHKEKYYEMDASKRKTGDDVSLNTVLQDIEERGPVYTVVLKPSDAHQLNTKPRNKTIFRNNYLILRTFFQKCFQEDYCQVEFKETSRLA